MGEVFHEKASAAPVTRDPERRGEADPDQNVQVLPKTGEPAPGGFIPPSGAGHAE